MYTHTEVKIRPLDFSCSKRVRTSPNSVNNCWSKEFTGGFFKVNVVTPKTDTMRITNDKRPI